MAVGSPRAQCTSVRFGWPELVAVTDLASACRAIEEILEQGEGPRGQWRDAHFGQFVEILDEYLQIKQADPDFDPVRPVLACTVPAGEPVRTGEQGSARPLITDAVTARCADLFNVGYEILLQVLARYFAHTEETDAQLDTLAEVTMAVMFRVIKPLGDLITTLPAGAGSSGAHRGPELRAVLRIRLPPAASGGGLGVAGRATAGGGGLLRTHPSRRARSPGEAWIISTGRSVPLLSRTA